MLTGMPCSTGVFFFEKGCLVLVDIRFVTCGSGASEKRTLSHVARRGTCAKPRAATVTEREPSNRVLHTVGQRGQRMLCAVLRGR